jgi:hypothetical protein
MHGLIAFGSIPMAAPPFCEGASQPSLIQVLEHSRRSALPRLEKDPAASVVFCRRQRRFGVSSYSIGWA